MHKSELGTIGGKPLGAIEFARPDWPDGSVIYRGGDGPDLGVVGYRESDGRPVLVVEEVAWLPGGSCPGRGSRLLVSDARVNFGEVREWLRTATGCPCSRSR
jgi:hypothetical protein